MAVEGLIVGLGNPGAQYAGTRHNVGFLCIEALLGWADRVHVESGAKFKCELWKGCFPNMHGQWLFAKPQTFMNCSGDSVQPLAQWYKVDVARIVVIHDELDLPLGRMKWKQGGGNAGHNGLKSITQRLGTPDFHRLRIGIGRPASGGETVNYVLGHLAKHERDALAGMQDTIQQCFTAFANDKQPDVVRLANAYR